MYFYRFAAALSIIGAILLTGGCTTVREEAAEPGPIKLKRPDKIVYEKISSSGCELQVPHEVRAVSGNECLINVQLINHSRRSLLIKEWYMRDDYNFSIFYRRLPPDKPAAKNAPFTRYTPVIPLKPLPKHSELRLHPGNRALLSVELPFVAQLLPGDSAVYEVYVAITLNTFKLRSHTFTLYTE